MHAPEPDYSQRGPLALAALIAVLGAVSFIPPQSLGSIELRRANICSELFDFEDPAAAPADAEVWGDGDFRFDLEALDERIEAHAALPPQAPATIEWRLPAQPAPYRDRTPEPLPPIARVVPIEDFSFDDRIRAFCDTLLHARRPVRIAVLGDSFIEGDILTADLRELLQTAYAGGGAGFAPMASPLTAFRRTIRTQSKGWTTYNLMQHKTVPAPLRDRFFVSGWVCRPTAGASVRWECTDYRRRLDACTAARLLFIAPRDSRLEVTLNDSLCRTFAVAGSSAVRQLVVEAPAVRSLGLRVLAGAEEFIGYGAVFEGRGVVVDNYSIRSNNGQALFRTDPSVNAQIDELVQGYDLVILQYGLNIMQAGVTDYSRYGAQLDQLIAYVRRCFPRAAVLVLGVSDRSVKADAGFVPMDALPHLVDCQRRAARMAGAAFWPTSDAMRAQGGMARFVENGWAGKDYTHINYAGGRRVARALFDALHAEVCRLHAEQVRQRRSEALLDSLRAERIRRRLLPADAPRTSDRLQP